MSKNVNIKLKKADIYNLVQMESEYAGKQSSRAGEQSSRAALNGDPNGTTASEYEGIIVQDENFDLLDKWWKEAIYGIVETLSHYLSDDDEDEDEDDADASDDEETYDIDWVLEMPDNWRSKGVEMNDLVSHYLVGYLLTKWMIEVKCDLAEGFSTAAASAMSEIERALRARKRPTI